MFRGRKLWLGLVVLALLVVACSSSGGEEDGEIDATGAVTDLTPDVAISASVWRPVPGTTWQWQLSNAVDTSLDVAMYDIDLFEATSDLVTKLHADGRIVICYFSAGTHEDWRPDQTAFPSEAIGKGLPEWEGEKWLDVRAQSLRPILSARLDMAVSLGCDGVEPDNVDAFDNDSGFDLTGADQLVFNRWLADAAHERGLSVGLKNDLAQVPDLLPWFDWALNEECVAYDDCALLRPFIDAGKAVFHTEYVDEQEKGEAALAEVCSDPQRAGFSTLIKDWDLTVWRLACP